MQKLLFFIRKTSVAIIFIILEVIAIRTYAYSTPYTQARILVWSNSVVGAFHSTFAGITNYLGLRKENGRLTERIVELENRVRELEQYAPKEEVSVSAIFRNYEYISSRVIANSTSRPRNFITLDKGFADGVSADMAVLTPDGAVVGIVVDCSENYAVAKSILNADFRVGGTLLRDGSSGLIYWGGEDSQVVNFDEVSKYASIKEGDIVRAAGFSHFFPCEAVVGAVEHFGLSDKGVSYNCKVRLSADMSRLYNVILVRNTRGGEAQNLEDSVYRGGN